MSISANLLPEFDQEMASTRRVLERVAEDKLEWRPHPKSGTFGWLAFHVAWMPEWAVRALTQDSLDVMPADGGASMRPEMPTSRQGFLEMFDKGLEKARKALAAMTDEQMMQPWSLLKAGETLFTMPRVAVYRGMVMNHMIHHRAELCVYLRLNDIPVPGLYGPSADEPM